MGEILQKKSGIPTSRVAFLFKGGRGSRKFGDSPTEFFYGFIQLQQAGYDVEMITSRELNLDNPPGRFWRALSHLIYSMIGVPCWPLLRLARRTVRERLDSYDCLVVTTNILGISLGVLRRLKLIKPKIFFISMGLIEPTTSSRVISVYRLVFNKDVALRALSEIDAHQLSRKLGVPVTHIPFGVDISFWLPAKTGAHAAADKYVLSIGNDSNRDYQTLLDSWKPTYPLLRIVTGQNIVTTAPNVEILRGGWHNQILTDGRIRILIQNAIFVILPIKNTFQPSGQSACLQAMACGKAVIITNFPGLWNRELLRSGETCIIIGPPGDHIGIQTTVEKLLTDTILTTRVGENARKIVESDLNVTRMAEAIASDLNELATPKMA